MRIKFGLFIALFIAGCGIYEPAPDYMGEHEEEDTGISSEDINDGRTCEPIETCGADMCGVVDDGCGGTLECGPCNCVDGVAQSEVCGGCDLGVMRCEAGSTGSGFCDVPAIPGWSGDSCEGLVFVSPTGDAGGTGEKDSPLDSIVSGVAAAKSKGAVGVIVAGGSNDEYAGPVIVDAPISIVGGFDIDFQRKLTNSPLIYSHEPDGVVVDSVKGKILLERLEIRTADNSEPSGTTYAIRIVSSPRVKLSHVQGFAGAGGAGVSGAHGAQGARGADGQNGKDVHQGDDGHVRATDGGKNSECPEANGGNGGRGEKTSYNTTVFLYPAHEGQDSFGGAKGGTSGIPSEFGNHASGGDGEAGVSVIENGAHGQGGISAGEVQNGLWIPTGTGADGKRGKDGVGGGGGGGGSAIKEAYPAGLNGMEALDTGSSGGGGGAGGCGGAGGKGGSGGGASFGLFLVNSDIEIESSSFISSYGGAGGAGGAGGLGGPGGKGGKASQKYLWNEAIPDYSTHTYTYIGHSTKFVSLGGTGGNGGKGGTGGAGGGGAGGASVGIYCFKSKPVLSAVRVDAGGGGVGGESEGVSGASGLTADSFQCD